MAVLSSVAKYRNLGLPIIRVCLGIIMMVHGVPKLIGGPTGWKLIGEAMGTVGISAFPVFWGFMAAFSEAIGGLLLIFGLFFRPACILLALTMLIAALRHITKGDGFNDYSHALSLFIVFLGLFFTGPGHSALDGSDRRNHRSSRKTF